MTLLDIILFVISIVLIGAIGWVVMWVIDWLGVPHPINRIAKIVVAILFLLVILLQVFKVFDVGHNVLIST